MNQQPPSPPAQKVQYALARYARWQVILGLFILLALFMGVLLPGVKSRIGPGNSAPIDLTFFPSPQTIFSMLAAFDAPGRAFYRLHELTLDIIYPITYTLFFSLLITFLLNSASKRKSPLQLLNLIPFGTLIFDLLENAGIVTLLTLYPSQPSGLAWFVSISNGIKWLFAGAMILAMLISFGMWAAHKISSWRQ